MTQQLKFGDHDSIARQSTTQLADLTAQKNADDLVSEIRQQAQQNAENLLCPPPH